MVSAMVCQAIGRGFKSRHSRTSIQIQTTENAFASFKDIYLQRT